MLIRFENWGFAVAAINLTLYILIQPNLAHMGLGGLFVAEAFALLVGYSWVSAGQDHVEVRETS